MFWAWGFAFMFEPGNGFIGTTGFFLKGLADTYGTTGVPAAGVLGLSVRVCRHLLHDTSGAMVGRCGFIGDILYSIGVTGFIYPIIGHWAWGPDGWLAVMALPFRDFAGIDGGPHDRRRHFADGRDRARPAARPRVPA